MLFIMGFLLAFESHSPMTSSLWNENGKKAVEIQKQNIYQHWSNFGIKSSITLCITWLMHEPFNFPNAINYSFAYQTIISLFVWDCLAIFKNSHFEWL